MKNTSDIELSPEQKQFIQTAKEGKNILVNACIGSGKTTAIQYLCNVLPKNFNILYLTYNKLLKIDAQSKIKNRNTTVTNYHGFAYSSLLNSGITTGIPDLIQRFNKEKPTIKCYDVCDSHGIELFKCQSTVERLSLCAFMLSAFIQEGHDYIDPVCLACGR